MTRPLPVSGRVAWWGTAWLRGAAAPDDVIDAIQAGELPHTVSGIAEQAESLLGALAALRHRGATAIGAAFPAEGDPVGLGGPVPFNTAALEAGEAVVCADAATALVPLRVGPTYQWVALEARRRQLPDVGEADRGLRAALLESADLLARLDVARWRPEAADELLNLRRVSALEAPPGVPTRCVDLAARGLQALGIAALALEDDGGALTAADAAARRSAIVPLDRAGRRALTAACSPEVWPVSA
jgi:hypothetical protein